MIRLTTRPIAVSRSGNIALYPALAARGDGRFGLAWYEYGSPHQADRSDIWFSSADGRGGWTAPRNVSAGISYNNGPSLIWSAGRGGWLCAWHSWRPPGTEPFVAGGDVTNLWCADLHDDGGAHPAWQALPGTLNTEYASLSGAADGGCHLLYHDRGSRAQCVTYAAAAPFHSGERLPEIFDAGSVADVAAGADGTLWVAYVARRGGIYLTSRRGADGWAPPRRLDADCEDELTRPKISVCEDGTIWIACHSSTWGRRRVVYRVRIDDCLTVQLRADGTPGNHCWTCNAIGIRGERLDRTFSFGPDVFAARHDVIPLPAEECLYDRERGYGFDRRPGSQLRELGDELTRTLFYDPDAATFRADVPPGDYEVDVLYSSWIAPRAGTLVQVDGAWHEEREPQGNEAIHVIRVRPDGGVERQVLSENRGLDENRPSRVVHDARGGKHIAWTRYGPERIDVVYAAFAWDRGS